MIMLLDAPNQSIDKTRQTYSQPWHEMTYATKLDEPQKWDYMITKEGSLILVAHRSLLCDGATEQETYLKRKQE